MLKNNKTMGDAHDDVQLEGIGGDAPPHVHKIYKPGGHPQTDTKEHRPTMTMMEVKTARPQVTGSIELIEDQLVYQKRTGNVTKEHRENFGPKVIRRGTFDTPESSSTMVDSSRLQVTTVERDTARSSMESWPPTITGSGVTQETGKHAMAEILRQSLSDYISQRSIPPLSMKSWMNHKFPTDYRVVVMDTRGDTH